MSKMIQVGSYKVPKEDWESVQVSAREVVEKLVKEDEELREKVHQLEGRLSQLEERLNQNSRNSSRPPSKDEVGGKRRKESINQEAVSVEGKRDIKEISDIYTNRKTTNK